MGLLSALDREAQTGGGPREYAISKNGELELITFDSQDAVIPDEEMYRCLELYGVATKEREITWGDGESSTKLPVLLRIIDENDAQHREIMQVDINYDSQGPKSSFGEVMTAITGEPFTRRVNQELWEEVIGGKFGASLRLKTGTNGGTFVNLVYGSVKPYKAKAKPAAKKVTDEDPFNEEDVA